MYLLGDLAQTQPASLHHLFALTGERENGLVEGVRRLISPSATLQDDGRTNTMQAAHIRMPFGVC